MSANTETQMFARGKSLSLTAKLTCGFITAASIALLIALVGYRGASGLITQINANTREIQALAKSSDLARETQVTFKKQVQAWKDILLRGHDPAAFHKYLNEFNQHEDAVRQDLQSLKSQGVQLGFNVDQIDSLLREHAELDKQYRKALKSYDASNPDAASVVDKLVRGIDRGPTDDMSKLVANIQQFNDQTSDSMEARLDNRAHWIKSLMVAGVFAGILLATAGIFLSRSVGRKIRGLAINLGQNSQQVASASGQISASSQTLAEGASQQAAALEETSSSLEEMASMTKRNAENAAKANELARQARTAADKGAADMESMSTAMTDIQASSNDIAKIIKTIDEIAFQTNILALNAAVEAARAGEAGMGFAVVADEVRNLAQRSAEAAKETAAKIEGAMTKATQGVEINQKVVAVLGEILEKARHVDELVDQVASASREQSQGITQINAAVGQMDKVTQNNAANAEESAAASEELNAQAHAMKEAVSELLNLVNGNRQTASITPAVGVAKQPAAPTAIIPNKTRRNRQRSQLNTFSRRLNCWEFKKCGREAGGSKAQELGVCPAYPDHGRDCATLAGTLCGGKVQGSFAQKLNNCIQCDFYNSPNYNRRKPETEKSVTARSPRDIIPLNDDFKDF